MMQPRLSLLHADRRPDSATDTPPVLFMLHGYGANEHDLHALAPYIDPRFLVISPRAPQTLMSNQYAWFPIDWTNQGVQVYPDKIVQARDNLLDFIEAAVTAYRADRSRIFLGGFSQGAIMSAAAFLQRPDLIAGALLMSGSATPDMLPPNAGLAAYTGKPVLITHGLYDPVLTIDHGRRSRKVFDQLPVDLTYREYPMGHEINMPSLNDVSTWLRGRLG